MNNKRAANIYQNEINEIAALLDDLKSYIVYDHMGVSLESVTFGAVGSAKHLKRMIKEAAAPDSEGEINMFGFWKKKKTNNGDFNRGDNNNGDFNRGDNNNGDFNRGDCNSGSSNNGDYNNGHMNSGRFNRGEFNSGNGNSGFCNSGDCNSGNWNTGNRNCGNCNSGDFNLCDFSSGCFNTETPKISLFNQPSNWTLEDWRKSPAYAILQNIPCVWLKCQKYELAPEVAGDYLAEKEPQISVQEWWNGLLDDDKAAILALPNFDAAIFKRIAGIDVNKPNK